MWKDGHICVDHPRQPWDRQAKEVIVHARYDELKKTDGYNEAKRNNNYDAAMEVVKAHISDEALDKIVDVFLSLDKPLRIVRPLPSFDDSSSEDKDFPSKGQTNALPAAFSAYICETLGVEPDDEITQVARVGRTKLNRFNRFLCQPNFRGFVRPNEHYMIVDDVLSTGGTFAALRSQIVKSGGSVALFSALAHNSGLDTTLAIDDSTLYRLKETYGDGVDRFWLEVIGHEVRCLTESEAGFLIEWGGSSPAVPPDGNALLQRLRDRFDSAASTGE